VQAMLEYGAIVSGLVSFICTQFAGLYGSVDENGDPTKCITALHNRNRRGTVEKHTLYLFNWSFVRHCSRNMAPARNSLLALLGLAIRYVTVLVHVYIH
jgi:hypothetical protein